MQFYYLNRLSLGKEGTYQVGLGGTRARGVTWETRQRGLGGEGRLFQCVRATSPSVAVP